MTRRLERDGGSEYRLNGSGCRLLDVQDLVGGLGLGREMHSVISQGKVEALLNSTPEARRVMVEEAAGLGRFNKRRERAQTKLERTRQNLLRVADIEREVKAALRPLRQQAVAAERFAEFTEEWALAKSRFLLAQAVSVREAAGRTEAELQAVERARAGIESELAGLRQARATEEDRFASALQERERVGATYHRLAVEAEQIQGKATSLRQRVARIEADLDRARRRRETARADVDALGRRVAEVTAHTADESRLERVGRWGQALRAALEGAVADFRGAAGTEDELKDAAFEMESTRARALQDREFLRREIQARQRIDGELHTLIEETRARMALLEAEAVGHEEQARAGEQAVRTAETELRAATAARETARTRSSETARREAALVEALSGIEARRAVLEDLVARREGTPAGARELMARTEGCRLLAEVMEVEAGYERAVATALGPLAQAVVLGMPDDLRLVLEGDDVLEAIVPDEDGPVLGVGGAVPAGTRDLWELIGGPPQIIGTLRRLLPATAVAVDDVRLSLSDAAASRGPYRLVNRRGEMLHGGAYVARRREMGVETLLRARNELLAVAAERVSLLQGREEAQAAARDAATGLERAEALVRETHERLGEVERSLVGHRNDNDLSRRRLEEAGLQEAELRAREERESGLAEEMAADLSRAEEKIAGREIELEAARTELRAMQGRLERLRETVTLLEQKKAQAGLVEVRLRERCRGREGERDRLSGQRNAAVVAAERWERRTGFLERYLPLLVELLASLDGLADHSRLVKSAFEARLEEARAAAEGAARLMHDTAGSETGLQQEYEAMGARLAQLQVDRARQEDRRALLEEEMAELRRKHLTPRSLTPAEVAGENLELLEAAEERAGRRLDRLGPVNPLAEQECAELEERATFLAEQRRDLEASLAQLQEVVSDLDQHIEISFAAIFETVKENFSAVIATVFPGSEGEPEARGGGIRALGGRNGRGAGRGSGRRGQAAGPGHRAGGQVPQQVPAEPDSAVWGRESDGRHRLSVLALSGPALSLLHSGRGGSLARRHQHPPLPLACEEIPGQDSVHHHHSPATDHGGSRHAVRRDARKRRHLPYPFQETDRSEGSLES